MPIIDAARVVGPRARELGGSDFQRAARDPDADRLFSERGYHAVVDKTIQEIPERVDLKTGEIKCRTKAVYRIQIHFEASKIRRG